MNLLNLTRQITHLTTTTMKMRYTSLLTCMAMLLAVSFFGCKKKEASFDEDKDTATTTTTTADEQKYRVSFAYTWASSTHATNFPPGPHFSGMVGIVHNSEVKVWASGLTVGEGALSGMESMAETGSQSALSTNFTAAGDAVESTLSGGVTNAPGTASVEFTASKSHSLLSVVSMLAPSPDWFVGVHDVALLNASGNWEQTITRDMVVYDAGTDNGERYGSANDDTSPKTPIIALTSAEGDTDFRAGLPKAGTITIEQIN